MANIDVFKDVVIDEDEHEQSLHDAASTRKGNLIPKCVVSLEKLSDLQNNFQGPLNVKTHSSMLSHEHISLGTKEEPKYVNLSTPQEKQTFIHLFKQYHYVFMWMYDDIKTYDKKIIQHVIPIKEGAKPFQQKLRKFHPPLEPLIPKELTKLLDARIIYKV